MMSPTSICHQQVNVTNITVTNNSGDKSLTIIEPDQNADHEFRHRWIVIEFITIIFWPLHGASINQQSIF